MTETGGQMTFYFSSSEDGQSMRRFVEDGSLARPEFKSSRNAFVRYCIRFTQENDIKLKRDIKKIP